MVSAEIKPLTMSFGPLIPSIAMGEYKAKTNEPTRLLLRQLSRMNVSAVKGPEIFLRAERRILSQLANASK